jgi:transposase-like protein
MERNKKTYTREFKIMAVLLSYGARTIIQVAKELEIPYKTLSVWRQDYIKFGTGSFPGYGNLRLCPEQKKIQDLEKKIKQTDLEFTILKSAVNYLNQGKPIICDFIKKNEKTYSIRLMCKVLSVNRRTYSKWKKEFVSERQKWRIGLKQEIALIFFNSKQRYGCRRIAVELQVSGYQLSHTSVLKYMKELDLHVYIKKSSAQGHLTKNKNC